MILNISRQKSAMTCWTKTFNTYHRGLSGQRSMNLVDGSAFHKGVALGQATNAWAQAVVAAKELFDQDVASAGLMPEEDFLSLAHWQVVKKMIEVYRDNWKDTGMVVIQPECEFDVAIPGTEHNDITVHWYNNETQSEQWGAPTSNDILRGIVRDPHRPSTWSRASYSSISSAERSKRSCPCYQPHRLVGRTDGILQWNGFLWLQEHKTTSIKNEQFWNQWFLDTQLTGYIYGVNKATGMLPKGVVLNAIFKPSEAQLASWNKKRVNGAARSTEEYIEYYREIFLRSEADLARFEKQFISYANDWERRILENDFPMSNLSGHCFAYNRKCDFYDLCLNHDDPNVLESMNLREEDYVDRARTEQLIQIAGAIS